ncbi:MAG TPA: response regulator [Oligoflexus sp.]|uniref:response regulator transcription factor n=1 Tax=Oligoflexus sp. TaxID=1971216 RepID=UPI002D3C39C9|nr:response regulator [Oligoflexus sp.]HYX33159.1 response regulator [Oligoflexus sp.]
MAQLKGNEKILIIEDNKVQAKLNEIILTREGYQVFLAGSGAQGLPIANDQLPGAILLDWELPDSSAPELITPLMKNPHNPFLGIIVLTGHSEVEKLELALSLGAADSLSKPARKLELIARIKSVLRIRTMQFQLNELSIRDPLTNLRTPHGQPERSRCHRTVRGRGFSRLTARNRINRSCRMLL